MRERRWSCRGLTRMFRAGKFLLVAGDVLGWAGSVETAPERSLCVCIRDCPMGGGVVDCPRRFLKGLEKKQQRLQDVTGLVWIW
jgi:hypothetical protein